MKRFRLALVVLIWLGAHGLAHAHKLEYNLKTGEAWAWKFTWRETGMAPPPAGGPAVPSELELEGTLVQRVLMVHADGAYTLSIAVTVDRLRMVVGGSELPRAPALPWEQSRVVITKLGRVLEVRRDGGTDFKGLESLRVLALVKFPGRDVQPGEQWESSAPNGPKVVAKLAGIDTANGRARARIEMHTEVGLRTGGKSQSAETAPTRMIGKVTVEAAQTIDLATGITLTAAATSQTEMEVRSGSEPPQQQKTRVVLGLTPITVPAVKPPTPPAATPPKRAEPQLPPLKLKAGEIMVAGTVTAWNGESELTVRVDSFTNSQGRTAEVIPARSKPVTLNARTELYQLGVNGKVTKAALALGQRVAVVGKDLGSSRPLPASRVDIETIFTPPTPPGEKK